MDSLCTNGPQGTTETFVTLIQPGVANIHLSTSRVPARTELSHILITQQVYHYKISLKYKSDLLDTELLGAGSPVLRTPAGVAAIHVGVGLARLVQDAVLVHALISLGVPRSGVHRADFSGAGIACLLAHASVAIIRTDIGITELVGSPSHIPTLLQHCK